MAYLGQKIAKNAQSWLKLKLESSCIQWRHPLIKICVFWGSNGSLKVQLSAKIESHCLWKQITATVYCPAHFFPSVRSDGSWALSSGLKCLPRRLLDGANLRVNCTWMNMCGSFHWPTTLGWQVDYWFLSPKESGCARIFFMSMCAKSLTCITLLGFQNWFDMYRWRHQTSSQNGQNWRFSMALHPGGFGIEM